MQGFPYFCRPKEKMMQLIDTHTHLYLPEFDNDRDDVVKKAIESNVTKLLMPNIDLSSFDSMMACKKRYGKICYPMIGLHPTSVKKDFHEQIAFMEEKAATGEFIGIGEIGIDLYWDKTFLVEQIIAFKRQIELSLKYDLPVVIHSRDSFKEVIDSLKDFEGSGIRGVFHAFTGDLETAEKVILMGFKLGIGGIVTFKNSGLDKVVKEAGLENIILETDSPYLAPTPYRGKRNESSYVTIINSKIAEIFNIEPEAAATITTANSIELFRLTL
jgi:TatD DNase family protein